VTRLWTGRQGFDFRQGEEIFSLRDRVQTGSRVHGGSFPEGKAVGD